MKKTKEKKKKGGGGCTRIEKKTKRRRGDNATPNVLPCQHLLREATYCTYSSKSPLCSLPPYYMYTLRYCIPLKSFQKY